MTKVILVDDHGMVRDGFHQLIELETNFEVIGAFESVNHAIEADVLLEAEIVVSDISMGNDCNGFTLIEYLQKNHPTCKTIIVSMHEYPHYLNQARRLSVNGYISKRDAAGSLVEALNAVNAGDEYYSASITSKGSDAESSLHAFNHLTEREAQIFLLLARGIHIKFIASSLAIAIKTVHAHRRNIMEKFSFTSTFQITQFALKNGIIAHTELY